MLCFPDLYIPSAYNALKIWGTDVVPSLFPYMVFCREWVETTDGEMYAVELSEDLRSAVSEPVKLFSASENKYAVGFESGKDKPCFVTDGPFLYKEKDKVIMLWSSVHDGVYCVLKAYADSVLGKWIQCEKPVFSIDGGHPMVFKSLTGGDKIALHYPNGAPNERAVFLDFRILK